jgi:hypothetical protein
MICLGGGVWLEMNNSDGLGGFSTVVNRDLVPTFSKENHGQHVISGPEGPVTFLTAGLDFLSPIPTTLEGRGTSERLEDGRGGNERNGANRKVEEGRLKLKCRKRDRRRSKKKSSESRSASKRLLI